jgi:lyso-ornithine lipid O-acyltransferase
VSLRRCWRAVALAWALTICMAKLAIMRMRGPFTPVRRALWLKWACSGVVSSLGIRFHVTGTPPSRGLLVSNHLSYLDILILSAAVPCVFVSKAEVADWPYFGFAARQSGTFFIDRGRRTSAHAVAQEMALRLANPVPILVFPEGTSSDGSQVMRFHSSLFEPAIAAHVPVTAAAVRYEIHGGRIPERELCWFGDEGFLTHLWRALDTPRFSAEVRFGQPRVYTDRRQAAHETHSEVAQMRGQTCSGPVAPVTEVAIR